MSDEVGFQAGPVYRVPRRRWMDDGTRRLAIIAGGLGAVLIGVVGVWSLTGHRQSGRIPVVEADMRPLRVKPLNPGGMQLAGSNDEILSGDISPQTGKLAPAPEAPEPEALRVKLPPAPKAAAVAGVASAKPEPSLPPAVASVPTPPAPPAAAPKAATEAARQEPATASGRPALVQLAALGSEDDARAEWSRLSRRMPDLLKGHSPALMKTEHDGRTFWRLRTGGFSDTAQATAFCERVRAKGAGCSIASF